MDKRQRARALAAESVNAGDPTAWFDKLYREGVDVVPWAELRPNSNLVALDGAGKTALVIGCGLGDDAEQLAEWGFSVIAFDISPAAIEKCQERFPQSPVRYEVADLLNPPQGWRQAFDFVLEIYTVQALPHTIRDRAIEGVASFVKPGGKLLVIARGREEADPPGEMPWPLTRREVLSLTQFGLREESFEDYADEESVRRFRAFFTR
jgi:SAM-dependent methyltransferase